MWPWRKREEEARTQLNEAVLRREEVDRLVVQSRKIEGRLKQEVAKNGFTELFQAALQRPQRG